MDQLDQAAERVFEALRANPQITDGQLQRITRLGDRAESIPTVVVPDYPDD